MKARLTSISLTVPGRVIAIGEIVERGVDLPAELFDARVAAETAELVGVEHEPSPEIIAAIEAYAACFAPLQAAFLAAIDAVEAGGLAEARALVAVLTQPAPAGVVAQQDRVDAIFARVREADEAELQSLSASAESEAGADSAASKADGDSGGPSSSAENSSGDTDAPASAEKSPVEADQHAAPNTTAVPSEASRAASSDVAGAGNAPAADAPAKSKKGRGSK